MTSPAANSGSAPTMIHIAGGPLKVGTQLRQRCGWCGAVLIDEDLSRISVPEGQDGGYPTWPPGDLVETSELDPSSGGWMAVVEHQDGEAVPDGCCAKLDPAVTA